jgi:DNA-binding MarR family transcriptional regulator
MLYDDVSYLLGSKLSKKILECLNSSKDPLAPLQIAELTDIARSNVSTKLGQLKRRGLVKEVNPKARKWRFYNITDKGKQVLVKVKSMK